MARFLMTVWPLAGHYFPNLAIARALTESGHRVAFYSGNSAERTIRGEGFDFFPFRRIEQEWFDSILTRPAAASPDTLRYRLEQRARYRDWITGRLHAQVEDLHEIVDQWAPDALVCDPLMWGAYLVVTRTRMLKTAIFAYVPFSLIPSKSVPPLGLGLPRPKGAAERVRSAAARSMLGLATAPIRRAANKVRVAYGLDPLRETVSAYAGRMDLYLIAGTPEFDYDREASHPVHYVGPCLWSKPSTAPPPEWMITLEGGPPVVHVTEGTVHVDAPLLLTAAAKGLAGTNYQVVMATGTHRQPADMGLEPLAPNVRVESWISYDHLLPRTQVVVTTAGAGTVLSALAHGIPLVVVPTEWDKPEVARRAAEAGAAIHLRPSECTPARLRRAVDTVLQNPSYRSNAERLRSSFAHYGGPAQAADLLGRMFSAGVAAGM